MQTKRHEKILMNKHQRRWLTYVINIWPFKIDLTHTSKKKKIDHDLSNEAKSLLNIRLDEKKLNSDSDDSGNDSDIIYNITILNTDLCINKNKTKLKLKTSPIRHNIWLQKGYNIRIQQP